jgi:hypothetical protein
MRLSLFDKFKFQFEPEFRVLISKIHHALSLSKSAQLIHLIISAYLTARKRDTEHIAELTESTMRIERTTDRDKNSQIKVETHERPASAILGKR